MQHLCDDTVASLAMRRDTAQSLRQYIYIYIYIYILPESCWVVHFLAVLKVNRLSTVLSKSHFYSREKHFKS